MKNLLFVLSFMILVAACSPSKKENQDDQNMKEDTTATMETKEASVDPKLVKVWETDTVLTTNESVLYDADGQKLYVSNIDGKPLDKDGKGFISILSLDGKVENLKWATGLNAPKGMGIFDGHLYVTDIDRIVAIDLKTGKMTKEWKPEKADFLNDITVSDNAVYASDMALGMIHKIENGELSTVAEGVESVNGLLAKGDYLMTLDKNGLRGLDLSTGEFMMVNDSVTGGDGLTMLNDDVYIASRWKGEIYYVMGNKAHLLMSTDGQSQTADIGLNTSDKMLYVPTFFSNKVVAYRIED
ncbi:ATP/GTP-binding protein [Marivirga atlantica]|jgi:DNA-binding beta-propeller fold protein YncE|uniref:ATP-binding protein n=1 Tax=Marivirga atlantica TaxID=1548457 RepID=A0A937ADK8_9BACT|nr:ATP-binding protein [Marivirga atlantica]MBL0763689.1 ATP-binding protein [Marivirga atlantica]